MRLIGRYAPFESYINNLQPLLEVFLHLFNTDFPLKGKFSTDYDQFFLALNATYWILYGMFEAIPASVDIKWVKTIFEKVMGILNSDEN